jgi:hypothetical protein
VRRAGGGRRGGETTFAPPEGGQVIETDANPMAGVGTDQEAYYDGAAFGVRPRVLSAEETQFRQDVQAIKTFMGAANGSATDAQRDAVLKAFVRVARRAWIELRDE